MKMILSAWAIFSASAAFAGTTTIECKTEIKAQSGSGQAFDFQDLLEGTFGSSGTGHLRLTSQMGTQRLGVLDSGTVEDKGQRIASLPGFRVFSGQDTHVEGTIELAIPANALQSRVGTQFTGHFVSNETDTAPAKVILELDNMHCQVTGQR
jgi:hypothetical protein